MKWIVTANSITCRIYDYHIKPQKLTLIRELKHPENRLKNEELFADKSGQFKTRSYSGGTYAQTTDPEEVYIDNFARELALELDQARNKNYYNELIIVMPAQMEGLFAKHLNKHVKELISKTVQKNIMHLSDRELLDYLNETLYRI